jgi:hypothetical protein
MRELEKGSNPHSNGEDFSRSKVDFFLSNDATKITEVEIMTIITMFIESLKIISFAGKPFHWK